ncbi:MAG: redoxin domain-containing protein [Sphingomonadales bacterium]|jgi:peroxiredoxin
MVRRLGLLLIGLVQGISVFALPPIGQPAPGFSGTTHIGKPFQLSDLKGQITVLEWTNHDCPFVRKHYETGNMQALQKEAREKGVTWVSIISSAPGKQGHVDGKKAQRLTEKRHAYPNHIILDESGDIGRLYEARTTPQMYVIDKEGTLVYGGAIDDQPYYDKNSVEGAHNYVRAAINSVLAGEDVKDPLIRPYGCSVKYAR